MLADPSVVNYGSGDTVTCISHAVASLGNRVLSVCMDLTTILGWADTVIERIQMMLDNHGIGDTLCDIDIYIDHRASCYDYINICCSVDVVSSKQRP